MVPRRTLAVSRRIRRLGYAAALAATLLLLPCGCRTVRVEPFQGFHASVAAMHGSVDRALGQAVAGERDAVLDKLRTGELNLAQLTLVLDADGYDWRLFAPAGSTLADVPPYYEWKRTRLSLQFASLAVLGYADALVRLAKPELMTEKEFTRLTTDLDALAAAGCSRLEGAARSARVSSESARLMSAAAAAGFRTFVRQRRAADLRAALAANQGTFLRYTTTMGDTIAQLRANLQRQYQNAAQGLLQDKADPGVKARKLLDLNDGTIARLEMLAALRDVVAALPAAHAELAAAANDADTGAALHTLSCAAGRLARLADLRETDKPAK